ncbi:GTP-binding protein [Oceanispirochaeta sp.]|jgi:Ni2+-binding GTPase involved in maturation of urease and hydrogenase|uniref:GTP-binding protein n=1 Tax=Oceanispirochaeta sp. TaxID=2035350 RepID=UPI00262FB88C|nr:GTP-binding protein [Oceanispirochaeta sp.]MDA3955182.1 hypothetical protein [Oceanispirochaeta sp.]
MTQLIILGGFLGSGKTTFMVKAAEMLERRGSTVSVITNDQGDTLVDSLYAAVDGIDTREVSGGCFCCRFPDFLETVKALIADKTPDFIIAEAVGSCTDLAATVINPLVEFHKDTVKVIAYLTLVDGLRLQKEYLDMDLFKPLEPGEVLISHQIRESEVLVMSKTDLLEKDQLASGLSFLKKLNPKALYFLCSSHSGDGLDLLLDRCLQGFPLDFSQRVPLDYQVYADAEAAYGWYNGSWKMESQIDQDPMDLSFIIMESFRNPLLGEVAHAKLFITTPGGGLKVSFVSGHIQADEIGLFEGKVGRMKITLNIRSACVPETIEQHVLELQKSLRDRGLQIIDYACNSLIPSPPKPYYS